jgi:serine/threonine-protein kinase
VAILLTRKYSPQPVAEQSNNQVNVSPEVTPEPSVESSPTINIQPNIQTNQQVSYNTLTKTEAVDVINTYLQAKDQIFGPSFDREVAARVTTGTVYRDIVRPGGRMDSLKNDNAYWRFGYRKAEPLAYFYVNDNYAEIAVKVTEETYYYQAGVLRKKDNNIKDYHFILLRENGIWRIADRKSI